ncbi:hypothetical protein Zmor_017188 [Zophobas morio]|uniref:Uncharacterized protein n=1 Tax=Zophobas morio TaxID=2755281 RepID=A0AA38IBW7_9CUCU|nr:hypothetical protein Zmor_017188 [Zophobas morio]
MASSWVSLKIVMIHLVLTQPLSPPVIHIYLNFVRKRSVPTQYFLHLEHILQVTMENISFLEDETFGNLDPTEFSHNVYVPGVFHFMAEITKLLICLGSAGASVFLV